MIVTTQLHGIMNTRTQSSALRSVLAIALLVLGTGLHAQVLIGTDGGTTVLPSNTISWSVGEPIIGTAATTNGAMTQGYQQPTGKLIYYSRATGNVSDPIWSRTPTGPAGPANFIPRASMVVQAGHVVTNTATVDLRDVLVEGSGNLQLTPGSFFNIHGRNATFIGVLYGSDNSVMALVSNKVVVFTAMSKPNLWDLHVTTPQGTTASGDVDIRGTLQLNEGNFNATTATFALRSFAATTGRLGPVPPEASYTGNLKVERYIPGGATNWRLLGSPIGNQTIQHWKDDFYTAGFPGSHYPSFDSPVGSGILWPSIRWYNETNIGSGPSDGLVGVSSTSQPLVRGQGFAAWCGDLLGGTAPFVIDVINGTPHVATAPIALPMTWTNTGNPEVDGWNLVSNPVPSAIAFDRVSRGTDVEDYVTFYNPANGNSSVYDLSMGFGTNGASNTIQSSQGFYLKANGPDAVTTVEESDKINDNSGGIFGGDQVVVHPMVRLKIRSTLNAYSDETVVVFHTGTPAQDGDDVLKYVFALPQAPQIATLSTNSKAMAINAYGPHENGMNVPVTVNAGVTGTYTIDVTEVGIPGFSCVALEDLITGTITPLNGALSYDFSLNADANPDAPRFRLRTVVPEAAFIAPTTVEVNTPIVFDNTSADGISYTWDFGDGNTSTAQAPTHTYTIGGSFEVSLTATTGNCSSITTRTVEVSSPALPLRAKVMLQGAYDAISGLMRDDLRLEGLLPIVEPYTALGYTLDNSGANTSPAALAHIGNDAYVDWVMVELRSSDDPTMVVSTLVALVQRDGDVVGTDGTSPVFFPQAPSTYHIVIRHRNHLGVMTRTPVLMTTSNTTLDFTLPGSSTYGTDACALLGGTPAKQGLWAGDVTSDGTIKYTGSMNDRDPILQSIGGAVPTNTITGYHTSDVNMDGNVKYTGTANDRDIILQNIGGIIPTNIRVEQVP